LELNSEAAKTARQNGLTVWEGDATEIDVGTKGESFDCIVYADVLEHLTDPLLVLRRHATALQDNGTVVVSVPNFRNYMVFTELFVRGHVRYTDAGILDRTHLRLTTSKMVREWFAQAGLRTTSVKYIMPGCQRRLLSAMSFGLLREFIATQILVVGAK
jgi:2-polyprenyl-3-methyl-5-hydroxy-6-metoxy-1,4-benzoquinol methylase